MHLHQVIESLLENYDSFLERESFTPEKKSEFDIFFSGTIQNLSACVPYHFEDIETIQDMTNRAGELFTGDYGKDIRLPFRNCWFDFQCSGLTGYTVAGILAAELDKTSIFVEMWLKTERGTWIPSPCTAYIGHGEKMDKAISAERVKNFQGEERIELEELSPKVFIARGTVLGSEHSQVFDMHRERDHREVVFSLRCFNACLLLLSCKNIQTEPVSAPAKLNKKRRKKGKPEIREYNVLRLVLPGKSGKSGGSSGSDGTRTQKPSFCSGHFKTYTDAAPLFGRLTGRYWWEPHVRGGESAKKKQRVIVPRKK
jgi:hypothetical protein